MPQCVEKSYRNPGFRKESGGNRASYLIVGHDNQTARWLFAPASRLITDMRALWHSPDGGQRVLMGPGMHLIAHDTNADGWLSRNDAGALVFAGFEWTAPVHPGQRDANHR